MFKLKLRLVVAIEDFRTKFVVYPGADPGFQVRGGRTLKNCAERREARKFLGYFV